MQLLGHLGRKGGPSIKYVGILSTDVLRAAHVVISNDSGGPPIARDGVWYAPEMTILHRSFWPNPDNSRGHAVGSCLRQPRS